MKIVKSKFYKPCPGVNRAFLLAEEAIRLAQEQNIPSYCLGKIVHNKDVVKMFEEKGLLTIGAQDFNKDPGLLVIRAHGIAESTRRQFSKAGFKIIDATCPRVAQNLESIKIAAGRGKSIIIIGNHGHSETKALKGVELFSGVPVISQVVETEEEINSIKDIGMPFFAMPQTTFNFDNFNNFKNKLTSMFEEIEIDNGLCNFCIERNKEVVKIAKEVEAVIVVGGKESANTNELAIIARKYCSNVWHIEDYYDIPDNISDFKTVGLCSGSSTPIEVLDKVYEELSSLL